MNSETTTDERIDDAAETVNTPQSPGRRILFIIDSLNSGGAQRQMVAAAVGLKQRGHQPTIFVYHADDFFEHQIKQADIELVRRVKPSRFSLRPIFDLRRLLATGGYDIAISYLKTPAIYAITAKRLTRTSTPLIVSDRSCHSPRDIGRSQSSMERYLVRADHVLANSHHLREHYQQRFPKARSRISTIWNGIDLKEFAPAADTRRDESLKILCVGNISRIKNWETLVEALILLKSQHGITPCVTLAGRTHDLSPSDQAYFESLKQRLQESQQQNQWSWLGRQSDMPALYRSHDLLVHPSRIEGLPNAICEALSSGLPVVAGSVWDHARLIQDGCNGLLFDVDSPEELAAKIVTYSAMDQTSRDKFAREARRFAVEHLSLNRMVDEYESLLSQVVEVHGQRK